MTPGVQEMYSDKNSQTPFHRTRALQGNYATLREHSTYKYLFLTRSVKQAVFMIFFFKSKRAAM